MAENTDPDQLPHSGISDDSGLGKHCSFMIQAYLFEY